MPKYVPCSVCSEMVSEPATVRATSPETGRPVAAALCEADGSCERVWRAAVEETNASGPRVEIEISFDGD